MHAAFILLHAGAGLVALIAGVLAVTGPAARRRAAFPVYFWSLAGVVAFLSVAVVLAWADLDTPSRVLFPAFIALGLFMILRAVQAGRVLASQGSRPTAAYLDHLGFTIVALFDAFAVIAVLDVSGSGWAAAGCGVLIAGTGHVALRRLKGRYALACEDDRVTARRP